MSYDMYRKEFFRELFYAVLVSEIICMTCLLIGSRNRSSYELVLCHVVHVDVDLTYHHTSLFAVLWYTVVYKRQRHTSCLRIISSRGPTAHTNPQSVGTFRFSLGPSL